MAKRKLAVAMAMVLGGAGLAGGETVADRQGAVLGDRERMEDDPRWIYNDLEAGFAEGLRTGKPVLFVLRCIPCLACAGIDAKVLLEDEGLAALLDRFVCVRVINANALDLSKFQFDFDLSFSALIFHGDGNLLGRYGSWKHQRDPAEETTAGFRRALEAALALYEGYPGNRAALAGKQAGPSPHRTPVDMPGLRDKYTRDLDWEGGVVQSCVHCHQIGDAMRAEARGRGERLPLSLIYPYPGAEAIGLELAGEHGARVRSVLPGSAAGRAGLREGDELLSLEGQPLISEADVSWVLHRLAEGEAELAAVVRRGERVAEVTIGLDEGWRFRSDISRRVGTWGMRAMALGGLRLEELGEDERAQRGIPAGRLALLVKHVGQYGQHAAAKRAGFRAGDVIVELDGEGGQATESEWIGRLLTQQRPGDKVPVVVVRGGRRLELELPMQ